MIRAALIALGVAAALGLILAARALRDSADPAPRVAWLAVTHGIVGLIGFVALLVALQGPARGLVSGTASFGTVSACLFGLAIPIGVAISLGFVRRRGLSGGLIAAHAGAAIAGFVIVLAWAGLP